LIDGLIPAQHFESEEGGVAHLVFISSITGDSQLVMAIPENIAGSKLEVFIWTLCFSSTLLPQVKSLIDTVSVALGD
jgi:hypothetical protein